MSSISFSSHDLGESRSLGLRFARLTFAVAWLDTVSLVPWAIGTGILVWQGLTQEVAVLTFTRSLYHSIFGFELSIISLIQLRCGSALAKRDGGSLRAELWRILVSLLGMYVVGVGVVLGSGWALRAIGVEDGFAGQVFWLLLKVCVFAGLNVFATMSTGLIVTAELSSGLGMLSIFMIAVYSATLAIFMIAWPLGLNGFIIALSLSTAIQTLAAATLLHFHQPCITAPATEEERQPINPNPDTSVEPKPEDPDFFSTVKVTLYLGFATAFETVAVELNYLVLASTNQQRDIYVYGVYMLVVCFMFFVFNGLCAASRALLLDFLDRGDVRQFMCRMRDFFLAGLGLVAALGLAILAISGPFARAFGPDPDTRALIALSLLYGFWFNLVDFASAYINTILPIVGLEKQLFFIHTFIFLPLTLSSSIVLVVAWRMGVVGAILSFIFADILPMVICLVILKRKVPSFLRQIKENKRLSSRAAPAI